ncbi:MAG TPA: DNA-binding protein [Beijerinckiaceae bacterium]|nr:DNA-binding protein [Rhodoblastus sp.]MCC0000358.1 DNA-binding protein [Methylobacteriaceae bacterium]MCC2100287.1 DNA-binding protein [Hyphomicrobiales bacterium]MCO5087786.1 DNA-binding protein [Methylobacteriaceae bacterium]HRY02609.1 DNA-binding protein [Beijerinckiaceae bacterium]
MHARLINGGRGSATFAIVLQAGDEVIAALQEFVDREEISAAQFSAIGAFSEATLRYFDWETKRYEDNPVNEQVEVAALNGDVALAPDGSRALHIHTVLGRRDGSALAGHLGAARVRPTLEIVLREMPLHLHKKIDPQTGLALIAI